MPVNYGVLRGKVVNSIPYKSGTDHFQIEVQADQLYRIAIDVYSQFAGTELRFAPGKNSNKLDRDRMVMFYKDEDYVHSITDEILAKVKTGFTARNNMEQALCLDYLRFDPPLFPLLSMRVVEPKSTYKAADDLNDDIRPWVTEATYNADAEVFAFGSGWDDNGPAGHPDTRPYFTPNHRSEFMTSI